MLQPAHWHSAYSRHNGQCDCWQADVMLAYWLAGSIWGLSVCLASVCLLASLPVCKCIHWGLYVAQRLIIAGACHDCFLFDCAASCQAQKSLHHEVNHRKANCKRGFPSMLKRKRQHALRAAYCHADHHKHAHLNSVWCKQLPCICGDICADEPHTRHPHCDSSSSHQPSVAWGWRCGYEPGDTAVRLQACTSHWYVSSWDPVQ